MSKKKMDEIETRAEKILEELRVRTAAATGVESAKTASSAKRSKTPKRIAETDTATLIRQLRADQKVIYGMDNRADLDEVIDEDVQRNSNSVVGLIDIANIIDNGDGTSIVRTVRFGDAQRLCSSERFLNQQTAPFCSGFLVAPNLVATAGHCIDNNNLARTRFIFGFRIDNFASGTLTLPNTDIFKAEAIVGRELDNNGADYAVVRLERPAIGKPVAKIQRAAKIADNQSVYVIGHPSGLPMKYAPDAVVRDNQAQTHFVANLDTYGGNSGSAVFNADTHEVEGILVRGETDFVNNGTCFVSNVCPTTGCRGEDIARISLIAEFVPETQPQGDPLTLEGRVARLETSITEISTALKRIEDNLNS